MTYLLLFGFDFRKKFFIVIGLRADVGSAFGSFRQLLLHFANKNPMMHNKFPTICFLMGGRGGGAEERRSGERGRKSEGSLF